MAITVHLEHGGAPVSMLLDIVKLSCRHTGQNLAMAFSKVLREFGIEKKVSNKPIVVYEAMSHLN